MLHHNILRLRKEQEGEQAEENNLDISQDDMRMGGDYGGGGEVGGGRAGRAGEKKRGGETQGTD